MLNQLEHLVAIVEHRTFTEAARRVHLSQPALTASIRKLEDQLGARLLHRGRRGATLTEAGEALLPHARAAIRSVQRGERAVRQVLGLEDGEVRLAGGATACTYFLPPVLARLHEAHPKVRVRVRETITEEALIALRDGEIDLALVTTDEGEPWVVDELILVGKKGVSHDASPFVTFRPGATSRTLLDEHFPDAEITMELGGIGAVMAHVSTGIGVGLVSRFAAQTDLALGRVVEVPHAATPIARPISIVHAGLERLSVAARTVRELLFEGAACMTRA